MAYGVIEADFWDDEGLADLSVEARLLACFLITGRQATLVPGLINLGVAGLAEAARLPEGATRKALAELVDEGFCEVDEKRRLIRVPNAPKYNKPNSNVLSGWFNKWKSLPNCPMKAAHVDSIRAAVTTDKVMAVFESTFGSADINPSRILPESLQEGYSNHSRMVGVSVSGSESVSESAPEGECEGKPRKRQRQPALDLGEGQPKPANPRRRYTDRFTEIYRDVAGVEFSWGDEGDERGKNGQQVSRIMRLANGDATEAIRRTEYAFYDPPPGLKGLPDLGTIVAFWNKLAVPGTAQRGPPNGTAPNSTDWRAKAEELRRQGK